MVEDWSNREVALRWDSTGDETNPTRSEQLDILVTILAQLSVPGKWILDLGYGSGKVEKLIFERIPHAQVVGVDGSDEMMKLAERRLAGFSNPFETIKYDLAQLPSLQLPAHPFQFVIAIQSLHHLSKTEMRDVYSRIYDILEPGGLFLLLDRIRVETESLWRVMHEVWKRQDEVYGSTVATHEGDSFQQHEQSVRERGDFPVLLDEHLTWLRESGFEAACLHAHGNRALVVGCKS